MTYQTNQTLIAALREITDTQFAYNDTQVVTHGGIVGNSGTVMTGRAGAYDLANNTIAQTYNPGTANAFGSCVYYPLGNYAVYGGSIWAAGPYTSSAYTNNWWKRNFTGDSAWTSISSLWPLVDGMLWKGHGVCHHKGSLYYFGGFNHTGTNTTFRVTNGVWSASGDPLVCTYHSRMPYQAQGVSAVSDGKHIYIYGGTSGSGRLAYMYRLDTTTNVYTRLPDLPAPTSASPGVFLNGFIIFLVKNPLNNTAQIVAFNPETLTYNTYNTSLHFLSGYAAYIAGGKMYITGGSRAYWTRPTKSAQDDVDVNYTYYFSVFKSLDAIIISVN